MGLDPKGIALAEVSNKYPRSFQTLGYDVLLDVDSMYKPKVITTFQMCVNAISTLLFMKPGQYPSIPDLGIDIESYLHEYADDPNTPAKIKTSLQEQCNRINIVGIDVDCSIDQFPDGTNALVVKITATEKLAYGSQGNTVIIGISHDKLNRLYAKQTYL